MADMLIGYLSERGCVRAKIEGTPGNGIHWKGSWKRVPYAAAMRRAHHLLGIRRGNKGCIKLPPNWKGRIGEAGIDPETMSVEPGEEQKWARAWKQFCEYDSFRIDRQRVWNATNEPAPWPCPELTWEARANSKVMRGKKKALEQEKETQESSAKGSEGYDVTRRFRKRISMRQEGE
jgi:hypothetical protein